MLSAECEVREECDDKCLVPSAKCGKSAECRVRSD